MNEADEYTSVFFTLLPIMGKRTVIEWCIKECLIVSRYECLAYECDIKPSKNDRVSDGFEWHCRVQSSEGNKHNLCRSLRKGTWFENANFSFCKVLTHQSFGQCMQKYVMVGNNVDDHANKIIKVRFIQWLIASTFTYYEQVWIIRADILCQSKKLMVKNYFFMCFSCCFQ